MALDFYSHLDTLRHKVLFSLSSKEFFDLEQELTEFERRTGAKIDCYGSGRINDEHIITLKDCVGKKNKDFLHFLSKFCLTECDLIFEGD